MLLVSAMLILIVCVSVPILTRNYRLFTIWNYFLAFVVLNIVVRTFFIVFDFGTVDPWSTFLKNLSIDDLIWGSLLYAMACFFLCLGYLSVGKKVTFSPGVSQLKIEKRSRFILKQIREFPGFLHPPRRPDLVQQEQNRFHFWNVADNRQCVRCSSHS